ncbi:hypothetical protein [Rubrivirga sp.]|uniref:hypothetical protein n=1 Tax=Rubrivirga sp. TaxID=1885344 RepID=UPI003C72C915
MSRLSVLVLLLAATGCVWEGRPDGADAVRTASDGYFDADSEPQSSPLGGIPSEVEIVEPLEGVAPVTDAPVDLSQPPPTTGTADATTEVEEALTPGTER